MKPGKVLAPILLAIGLVGINPSLTRADTKPIEMKRDRYQRAGRRRS